MMRLFAAVLVCLGSFTIACSDRSGEPPKAIVLLVVDTLRADRLSSYGYGAHETPHMDSLATRGARFSNAHSVASWTVPSMGALLTSRHPRQLGLIEQPSATPVGPFDVRDQKRLTLPTNTPHLAAALKAAGYRTAAFVDQPMLNPARGFGRAFDEFFGVVSRGHVGPIVGAGADDIPDWSTTPFAFENDAALVERFSQWLSESEGPVFAWLHLLTTHAPYVAPAEFTTTPAGPMSPHSYDAEVRAADALVGRALAAIERAVGLEQTLVVLTSDHGESFGEHGDIGHGQSLHREVAQVPLILAGPRVPAGIVIDSTVRILDIAPTLLAIAGAPDPQDGFEGESLIPTFTAPRIDRSVYAEGMLYGPSERSLMADGFRLIIDEQRQAPALYSMQDDPHERKDVSDIHPDRVRMLSAALAAEQARLQVDGRRTPDSAPSKADRDALRALGYLDEKDGATP